MGASRTIVEAARAAARSKAVQGLAASAGAAAAARAGAAAEQRYGSWRERRLQRDRAIKLARQMRGRVSHDTIIDGEPHVVVWKDGHPVQAFPPVADLTSRPELQGFDDRLAVEPPPLRPPRRFARPGA